VLEVEEYLWKYIEKYHCDELQSIFSLGVTYTYSNDNFQQKLEVNGGSVESVNSATEGIVALCQKVADHVMEETFPLTQHTHADMLQRKVKDFAENGKLLCYISADGICHIVGPKDMVPDLKRVLDVTSASVKETKAADTNQQCIVSETSIHNSASESTSNRYSMLTPGGIMVEVYQGDLVAETVDVIVNPANSHLRHGSGAARAIANAAGWKLEDECKHFIRQHKRLNVTKVTHTSAGNLEPKIRFVIHAVGPRAADFRDATELFEALKETFFNCLHYANVELRVSSVSVPAISSGTIYYLSHCYSMGHIVKSLASVCLSVSHCSYGCDFYSILMKFCTEFRSPKSKNNFVNSQNLMTYFPILPQFFIPLMHFQWVGLNNTVMRPVD